MDKLDCWDVIQECYKEFLGKELPVNKNHSTFDGYMDDNVGLFGQVEEKDLQFGDILVFKDPHHVIHFGFYVGEGSFIHKRKDSLCIKPISRFWRLYLYGCYRVNNPTSSS